MVGNLEGGVFHCSAFSRAHHTGMLVSDFSEELTRLNKPFLKLQRML